MREPRAALGWVDANLTGPMKEEALVTVTMKWAGADPEAAAAWFVSTGSTSESVLSGLIDAWADLDPHAAARWVETLKDDRSKILGRIALVLEWSNQNPAEASAYAMPYLSQEGGADMAGALVNAWGTTDPQNAAKWIDSLPAGTVRDQAAGTLATIWAANDINAATQWATQLPESQLKSGVIDHIATTWGAIEPQKALAWLSTLPLDETRMEATRGALDSWAGTEPNAMAKWIESEPAGAISDQARVSLGSVQIDRDPPAAMQTALGISDPGMRRDELVKYYRRWSRRDAPSATAWLQTAPLQPDLRQTIGSSVRR